MTLWQEFIGAAFLESLARAGDVPADSSSAGDKWKLDLYSVAAASKPSPYLPICVIATKLAPSASEAGGGGGNEVAKVAAWCDSAGRPLRSGVKPFVLIGEKQVGAVWEGVCVGAYARFACLSC